LEEQEKKKKQKKKGKEEEPEINQAEFKYLPKHIVIEMIQERLKEEDCNAGAIFDCLESPQWPNLKFALEAICDAVPT
jgi:adenylate kinase family enzyme